MKRSLFRSALSLLLALILLAAPAAALTVQQTRDLLEEYYVDPIPQDILDLPTTEEILNALGDPYTNHLSAEEYQYLLDSMSDDTLVGIGVSIPGDLTQDDPFLLQEVFEGGPAQKGGLRPGDVIVAVDHVDVQGMHPDEIIARIRGELGTPVSVTYLREGVRRSVTLIRDTVSVPATTGTLLEGGVCYIQCTTWGEETLGHFHSVMGKYVAQTKCWLIDLRGNPGGLTDAATSVAGLFCGPGDMLFLRSRTQSPDSPDGYAYEFYDSRFLPATEKPVVILVDDYTASASEAFASALRDYGRAVIVGDRTFGKGVAQGILDQDSYPDCFADGDCLKITIARFYSPNGNTNDVLGVIPHFLTTGDDAAESAVALAQLLGEAGPDWRVEADRLLQDWTDLADPFSDTDGAPYADAAAALAVHGLVAGKGDGQFHGEDTLTRAELAQMLANALHSRIPADGAGFDDVSDEAWYADAVAAIAAQGMMRGTGEGRFSPEATLTHQELLAVLGRLGCWLNDDLDLVSRRSDRADWDLNILRAYDDWAKSPVWLLSCSLEDDVNLLWDEPDAIEPTAPATRGEAALALYTLLNYLLILP